MFGETFYGRHTAQHQLQWRQIKKKKKKKKKGSFKVDWTFELLWDPLLTISPNLFFWKQLTVRSLQSK